MYDEILENMSYTLQLYPLDDFATYLLDFMDCIFPIFLNLAIVKAGLSILKSACTW